jgi:hypothetical protein
MSNVEKFFHRIEEETYSSFWINKEDAKELRSRIREKYPYARIEKLSGVETVFLFISITKK